MGWRLVVAAVLLSTATGCPHDWMPEGTNDRAMRKDNREALQPKCPEGKALVDDPKCEPGARKAPCPKVCR